MHSGGRPTSARTSTSSRCAAGSASASTSVTTTATARCRCERHAEHVPSAVSQKWKSFSGRNLIVLLSLQTLEF